ncbi:hypothetical protein ACFC26_14880 [Kitasatospora purpeofusca]|uniref:hypothetical protein n=1 Tax=Kitasatospora purpeofusca TaxID=67352 RepID=UPI0035DAAA99
MSLVVLQVMALRTIRTGLLQAAAALPGPDASADARHAVLATDRAILSSAHAERRLREVFELVLAVRGQPPTEDAVVHAQWLYRDAALTVSSASRDLRQAGQLLRNPAVTPGRRAVARLRTSLRLPFRKDRTPKPTSTAPQAAAPARRR